MLDSVITPSLLNSLNVAQAVSENKENLDAIGGQLELCRMLGLDINYGLNKQQVSIMREKFGRNEFPESPMDSYLKLLIGALSDTTLLILMAAATVSVIIGALEDPGHGWIEGVAIFIAIALVANISAGNDYSKQLQFMALEASSAEDDRCSALREGVIEVINPRDLVVGDILVLQAGDMVPADSILVTKELCLCNESSLTGEPDDLKKTYDKDPFLLSSCLITEAEENRAVVIGIGMSSQWGKIKANLVTEAVNTPLQDKLEEMTQRIGYIGMIFALGTFIALIASIWTRHNGEKVVHGVVEAFIVAVTVVVVAIPEGLPLAVTIALAYSTKKMYQDQCFIRVLAACETMGNATNICSDKTGTLTENRMTVVEGYFGDVSYDQDEFAVKKIPVAVSAVIVEQCAINRSAYLVHKSPDGKVLERPLIIGNKTEGALIMMINSWGFDHEELKSAQFHQSKDKIFSFNSAKKRSTAVVHRPDGSVRIYCKGATEWVMKDCSMFLASDGSKRSIDAAKISALEKIINNMADRALRTLCLAHKDYPSPDKLPVNWQESPPDNSDLVLDCIVGIIDPLRSDVKEAVRIAQGAGVTVRMITGDNIATAKAIARQCGILKDGGLAVEGPTFRNMTPKDVDAMIPRLQVMARSSPDDKYLLVTRLNGYAIPANEEEWIEKMRGRKEGITWEKDRDLVMPGYREEWESTRPDGGEVVGVTGDGTNDAPALKAADVGLAMGITGTKVAQGASDIVILDDKFSSIVRAISWGRAVYDSIRKFLQFQLTVNLVALLIVFIGAIAGFVEPLNAVQLLWVNLVMDTMGALALATDGPTPELLQRKPYKRAASLISRPMMRNILCQGAFQLALLLLLLFKGAQWFDVTEGVGCFRYSVGDSKQTWDWYTGNKGSTDNNVYLVNCNSYRTYCSGEGLDCIQENRVIGGVTRSLDDLPDWTDDCLTCTKNDYTHGSIIFNAFIWCQIFNEYTARSIGDEPNCFKDIHKNYIFFMVTIITIGCQIFLIELGGEFVKTSHLTMYQWLVTIGLGAIGLPVGVLMRFIPVSEDPESFFDSASKQNDFVTMPSKSVDP